MNYVICTSCGHTTKPGLADEKGRCPLCQPPAQASKAKRGSEEKSE